MGESQAQFRQRLVTTAVEHLVERIVLNADSPHAARLFLDATVGEGTLTMPELADGEVFLDALLPVLDGLDRLSLDLVPVMIREYGWPETLVESDDATGLRADVRALLARHARETWVVAGDASLVGEPVDRMLRRRMIIGGVMALVLLVVAALLVLLKIFLRSIR